MTLILLLMMTFVCSANDSPEVKKKPVAKIWVHGAVDTFKIDKLDKNATRARPRIGFDVFLNHLTSKDEDHSPFSIGGEFSSYRVPTQITVDRSDLTLVAGYWFIHQTIGVLARYGSSSTEIENYDEDSSTHYGIEARYRIPISEKFDIFFGAGWTIYNEAELERDTGIPNTTNAFANFGCTLFSFGLSDGCGNQIQKIKIPKLNAYNLSAGVGFTF